MPIELSVGGNRLNLALSTGYIGSLRVLIRWLDHLTQQRSW
nr:MAG TPA: hypothetical protein [Caudoviricetes sp.]